MTEPRVRTGAPPANSGALRYRAFISYSHRDSRLVQRLHRRLETYSVPRALRDPDRGGRPVPATLRPVFRDRDELASASRLSDTIEAALDESEALIVVCSPSAVASQWVNAEILYFRRRHPLRPVFAFVVSGDPGADPRQQTQKAALPLALALDDPDSPEGKLGEPIAADARTEGDGFSAACLKLIAGLLDVRYDQLRQREQRRTQLRWTLAGAASIALSTVFAFLAWQATVARDQAEVARAKAELELKSERQTRAFLLSVFELADANESRGNTTTVREVLDRAVEKINRSDFEQPVIRARFLATMGQAYSSLGLNRKSVELLQSSIKALEGGQSTSADLAQSTDSRIELASVFFDMGEYDQASAQLASIEKRGGGPSVGQQIRSAILRGDIALYKEDDAEASKQYTAALASVGNAGMPREEQTIMHARAVFGLAQLSFFSGDHPTADRHFAEALSLLVPVVGENHPLAITIKFSRGSNSYAAGDRKTARSAWTTALASADKVFDPSNPEIGSIKNNLGLLLLEDGDLKAAEPLLREALTSDRQHRSKNFDDLAYPLANLAYVRYFLGDAEEARTLLEEALPIAQSHDHAMTGAILNGLADSDCSQAKGATGLAYAKLAVAESVKRQAPGHWRIAQAKLTLAYCQSIAGKPVDRAEMSRLAAIIRKKFGPKSPFTRRGEAQAQASGPTLP